MATVSKKVVYKFPKMMGACADQIYALRARRQLAQKAVDLIEAEEKALKAHIIENLPKSQMTGASGKTANVKVITKEVPVVDDWDKFHAYIKRTGNFTLMQKRASDGALKELVEAGKKIPGVGTFDAVTLSITKV